MKTPVYTGLLQSDIDFAGFKPLNADLSDYDLGGGGGPNVLITINVKDPPYNAVGDGVTDDTVAIQSAIDAIFATTHGGILFFPAGVYLCNGVFDATTNSILKIPYNDWGNVIGKPIVLQGQAPPMTMDTWNGAIIKTTKTGTGYHPALLAANPSQGVGAGELITSYFNGNKVYIKNMSFDLPDNPTLSAVRLDTAAYAYVENVGIMAGNVEPTTSTSVGLWMPDGGNGGLSYAKNVVITGFYNGILFAEHFIGHNIVTIVCKVGAGLCTGYQPSQLNWQTYWCPVHMAIYGAHHVIDCVGRWEDADPRVAPAWQLVVKHIEDPANTIYGKIDYIRVREPERFHGNDLILNGAANVQLLNLYTSSYHWVKIGTDMRLVSITGGAKLQVRNPGTDLWADADQWTNP